jgi:ATP-dependent Clp protease ATP-binding subunit ClpC
MNKKNTAENQVKLETNGAGEEPPTGRTLVGLGDDYNDEINAAVRFGIVESLSHGHRYVGTEHLLLGLVRQENCIAASVFTFFGVSVENARKTVHDIIGLGRATKNYLPGMHLSPLAELTLGKAHFEARANGSPVVRAEHLLMAIISEENPRGVAARVFETLSIDLKTVRLIIEEHAQKIGKIHGQSDRP